MVTDNSAARFWRRTRAISTDILEFRGRVLVIQAGKGRLPESGADLGHGSVRLLERGGRHGDDHPPFADAAQLLKEIAGRPPTWRRSAEVTTTRAGERRMSVETARLYFGYTDNGLCRRQG
jgi:hypothetical protein